MKDDERHCGTIYIIMILLYYISVVNRTQVLVLLHVKPDEKPGVFGHLVAFSIPFCAWEGLVP